jgi:hypothetical protein
MQQLIDTIMTHFAELSDMVANTSPGQFESFEAESFCQAAGEVITLIEKNVDEMSQIFGEGWEKDLLTLKEGAVAVYRSIPHLEKASEILGDYADSIEEVVYTFHDTLQAFEEKGGGSV